MGCPEATHKYINSQISVLELVLVTYDLSYTTLQWTRHQSLGFPLKYMLEIISMYSIYPDCHRF